MRFLSIGECMVEIAPDGAGKFSMNFAGDTFNTAWYLRKLVSPADDVSYLTAVGNDEISDQMVAFIAASGISTTEISRIPGRSVGLYMILLNNGERRFSYWRSVSAARLLTQGRTALPVQSGDLVYFSGITLAILSEPDREYFLSLVKAARTAGAKVAFDPNMRPRLWSDAGQMRAEIMKGAGLADIVLPSADEEAEHFGDATPDVTRARYLDNGAATVVVKNGAGVILAADPKGAIGVTPMPVAKLVDSTAAGDSFNAGFLATYIAGESLGDAIAQGSKVAGQVVQNYGALVAATERG